MSEREPDFTILLDGVEVGFRDMSSGQITMANLVINRARKRVREIGETEATIEMMSHLFDMIESMIVSEDHREHMFRAMLTGKIDLDEAYLILRRGKPLPPDDDEDVEVVKPKTKTKRVQL